MYHDAGRIKDATTVYNTPTPYRQSQCIHPGQPYCSKAVLVKAVAASRCNYLRCIEHHGNLDVLALAVDSYNVVRGFSREDPTWGGHLVEVHPTQWPCSSHLLSLASYPGPSHVSLGTRLLLSLEISIYLAVRGFPRDGPHLRYFPVMAHFGDRQPQQLYTCLHSWYCSCVYTLPCRAWQNSKLLFTADCRLTHTKFYLVNSHRLIKGSDNSQHYALKVGLLQQWQSRWSAYTTANALLTTVDLKLSMDSEMPKSHAYINCYGNVQLGLCQTLSQICPNENVVF